MSNGNGVHQDQDQSPNPYQLVEEFIAGIGNKIPEAGYSDLVMALLAGAAHISIVEGDSLELFKAQSVVAYERMAKMMAEANKPQTFEGAVRHDC